MLSGIPDGGLSSVAEALRRSTWVYHSILIATLPEGLSRWLKLDLVSQARRRFHLPVFHVVAGPVQKPASRDRPQTIADIDPGARIGRLLGQLESADGIVRHQARLDLTDVGRKVVPRLIPLAAHRDADVRWEVTRLLVDLQDERAIPVLVQRLEDESYGVRWLAAEALASIGDRVLPLLFRSALRQPSSVWLLEGVHHVSRTLAPEDRSGELAG